MAYDTALADRIRKALGRQAGLTEKEMFGGVGFMVRGNMACGVSGKEMMVRVGPAGHDAAMKEPHVRAFNLSSGKPPKGWLLVRPAGLKSDAEVKAWVKRGVTFALSLPSK